MGLREEGLRAFGAWEPLAHRVRTGGAARGEPAGYDWEHTEEFIRGLKDRGFNLFITHFSKGYGIQAEAEERRNTRRIADLCHKHGLYVGGYVRYTTFIPDTMLHEVSDCIERFAAVTASGAYPRYNSQYWRFMPCPSSTDYLEYMDRLIEIGMKEVGLDCLHVDGLALRHEPYACHCARCREGFRRWLYERYPSAEARQARFGFANLDLVEPPDFKVYDETATPLPVMNDPLAQDWTLFRCMLLGRVWKSIVNSAHRHNPACVVQGNSSFYPDLNAAWYSSMQIADLLEARSEGFFTEEGNAPNLTADGRLHGYFETFKKLRRLGFLVFTYNREPETHRPCQEPERLKRAMAHQMAFNSDSAGVFCAEVKPGAWPATVPEYMAFHRDRRDLFQGAKQAHEVAFYYSERTRAFNAGTHIATQAMARDVLMRAHAPFGYLLAERRAEMAEFRAMILAEVECLSDAEAFDLAAYALAGGGLMVVGAATGRYDEMRRLRPRNVLAGALGLAWDDGSPAFSMRVGKGRVAFMPALIAPEGDAAELVEQGRKKADPYFMLDSTQWRPARNGADLVRMLEWSADGFRFEPLVPDTVVIEYARQEQRRRWLLHLVNYDLDKDLGDFEVLCRGFAPQRAEAFTPDSPTPSVAVLPGVASGPAAIRVGGFHRYLIVAVE